MLTHIDIEKIRDSASVFHDKNLKRFCISCSNITGGPVISADTKEEAWKLFNQALDISVAYKNIEEYTFSYEGLN
jgi:hypothetical protein